jgi:hypothetical protein
MILIVWPPLPRTTVGRILQRERATLRRLRDGGVGEPAEPLASSLERLLSQWVEAAAAGREVVVLELGLSAGAVHDWASSAYELLRTMTNEELMRRLGGPILSPSDASVLRGMIDHVTRLTSAD